MEGARAQGPRAEGQEGPSHAHGLSLGPSLGLLSVTDLEMVCGPALANTRAGSQKGRSLDCWERDGEGRRKRKQNPFLSSFAVHGI